MTDLEKREFRPRDRRLMLALVAGPMAALTNLTVSYALVPESCDQQSKTLLHVSALLFFLVAAASVLLARSIHRGFTTPEARLIQWQERTEWVARSAFILGIASMIVIVAMEIPNLVLESCK